MPPTRMNAHLFPATPARFPTTLPLIDATTSLRNATCHSRLFRQSVFGTVRADKVILERQIPFYVNAYKPVFYGHFVTDISGTYLQGQFMIGRMSRFVIRSWTGCVILIFLAGLPATVRDAEKAWLHPLSAFGMIMVAYASLQLGKWLARGDQQYISNVIREALLDPNH
jgi:hypothetical protein